MNLIRLLATVFILSPVSAFADTTSDADGIAGAELVYSGTILDEVSCSVQTPDDLDLGTWLIVNGAADLTGQNWTDYSIYIDCTGNMLVQFKYNATPVNCISGQYQQCIATSLDGVLIESQASGITSGIWPIGSEATKYFNSWYPTSPVASAVGALDKLTRNFNLSSGLNEYFFRARFMSYAKNLTAGSANATLNITFRFTKG